ncbi:MAG: RNA polymerase sigma factor [Lachnospiraceae bacterium]
MPEKDDFLYSRFLNGDTASYDALMLRYGDSLTIYLQAILHDWQDAEDMMVEAFAHHGQKPQIKEVSFKAYLFKTARNLALAYRQNRGYFQSGRFGR